MKLKLEIQKTKESCIDYYDAMHNDYFDKYSNEIERKPYDKDFLTRFAGLNKKNARILDIGCSSAAQQARFFRDNSFQVTSIDISKNCIETAKNHFPGIEFIQMDMLDMNFENDSFDAINAFYSIIHIPDEELNRLFTDFSRILKTGGKLSIAVHAGDFYGYYEENEVPLFFRTYTQNELLLLLKKHGFKVLEIHQRHPIYDFEFQSERIYLMAEKVK